MPPDRMIAEIVRRVPAGGFGPFIPVGGSGGGGADASGEGEDAEEGGDESPEELVAASDAAVDADRQATIASSGMMDSDSDSPSALYGDAAPQNSADASKPIDTPGNDDFISDNAFSEPDFGDEQSFSDDTSFSTDSDFGQQSSQSEFFGEADQTTTDVFDTGSSGAGAGEESGSGLFGTLWDFFMGDDE
eukprot:scaffold4347_cov117-Cylindrotheca_fusiformis.AAC.4